MQVSKQLWDPCRFRGGSVTAGTRTGNGEMTITWTGTSCTACIYVAFASRFRMGFNGDALQAQQQLKGAFQCCRSNGASKILQADLPGHSRKNQNSTPSPSSTSSSSKTR